MWLVEGATRDLKNPHLNLKHKKQRLSGIPTGLLLYMVYYIVSQIKNVKKLTI